MQLRNPSEREHYLQTIAVSRLRILVQIATYRATPWLERIALDRWPQPQEGWFAAY